MRDTLKLVSGTCLSFPHNPLNALLVSAVKLSFIGDPIHQSKQDSRGNKS